MTEQLLNLLNRHALVNCHSCQRPPETVGVYLSYFGLRAKFPQHLFNPLILSLSCGDLLTQTAPDYYQFCRSDT
jgi:hypothetical protein